MQQLTIQSYSFLVINCLFYHDETNGAYCIFHSVPMLMASKQWNQTCKLLSTHPSKLFPRWLYGSGLVCSGYAYSLLIQAATTLVLVATKDRRTAIIIYACAPGPRPNYYVSMSDVYSQCHKSWGELSMQSFFWLSSFEVLS